MGLPVLRGDGGARSIWSHRSLARAGTGISGRHVGTLVRSATHPPTGRTSSVATGRVRQSPRPGGRMPFRVPAQREERRVQQVEDHTQPDESRGTAWCGLVARSSGGRPARRGHARGAGARTDAAGPVTCRVGRASATPARRGDGAPCVEPGLYYHFVPKRFGGLELGVAEFVEEVLPLAEACASTAWVTSFCMEHNLILALFPEQAQVEIFGVPALCGRAGSGVPARAGPSRCRAASGSAGGGTTRAA